jgi:D-hydroxyproline dehydrogenase subunit beta
VSAQTFDVIIAGAGIVGAACARNCAQHGFRTAVIDPAGVGTGATAAGMGHIVVMDDSEAQFALTRYSQKLWQELRPELPVDVEYDPTGTIWVAADDEEMQEVRRKQDYYSRRGVPVEVVDTASLEKLEPNLRKDLAGGLLVPEDGVLYPPCAARYLLQRAQQSGAKLFRSTVSKLNKGTAQLADGTNLSAGWLVNATGAWAPELTSGLNIRKRKGHLAITDRYPGFVRHQLIELGYLKSAHGSDTDSVAFNVQPRKTGQMLIGSSRQFEVENKEVDSAILGRMLRRAQAYMPGLAKLSSIRVWTGFRAATGDALPLIGPHPEDSSLIMATGHEGLGITTSLATGRLVADHLSGTASPIPLEPYLPIRLLHERSHA